MTRSNKFWWILGGVAAVGAVAYWQRDTIRGWFEEDEDAKTADELDWVARMDERGLIHSEPADSDDVRPGLIYNSRASDKKVIYTAAGQRMLLEELSPDQLEEIRVTDEVVEDDEDEDEAA